MCIAINREFYSGIRIIVLSDDAHTMRKESLEKEKSPRNVVPGFQRLADMVSKVEVVSFIFFDKASRSFLSQWYS